MYSYAYMSSFSLYADWFYVHTYVCRSRGLLITGFISSSFVIILYCRYFPLIISFLKIIIAEHKKKENTAAYASILLFVYLHICVGFC
uniref:Uncharacterized protein n=1 Tax=Glossina morsitans morsitans TaxID=37546 RepID=A0A1A9YUE5_GLOMM